MLGVSYLELLFLLGLGSVILGQCDLPAFVQAYAYAKERTGVNSVSEVLQAPKTCLGLQDMQDK